MYVCMYVTQITILYIFSSIQFSSVAQSCLTLWQPMNCSTPGLPVHHQLPESTQTHVHWVCDAIQPSHPLLSMPPPALNLWKESYYQPGKHIKKQRHFFVNKGPSSQGYGFSSSHIWMWELDYEESWAPKNFELWCWRRLLRVPWTSRRSNQSIPKEINAEYTLDSNPSSKSSK